MTPKNECSARDLGLDATSQLQLAQQLLPVSMLFIPQNEVDFTRETAQTRTTLQRSVSLLVCVWSRRESLQRRQQTARCA